MMLPKHILMLVTGLRGRLNSCLALAQHLHDAGSYITIACPENHGVEVESLGLAYHQLPPTSYDTSGTKSIGEAKKSLGVDHLEGTIKSLSPDFLLIDIELAPHIIVCLASKIPLALISSWFDLHRAPSHPPLTSSLIPPISAKAADRAWQKYNWRRRKHFFTKKIRWRGRAYRSVLCNLAKDHEVEIKRLVETKDFFALPFYWKTIPILSMNLYEVDLPHLLPDQIHYVGPMISTERMQSEKQMEQYYSISQFLDVHANKKICYCSLSTMPTVESPLDLIVDAFSSMKDWAVIIASKQVAEPKMRENVFLLDYAPQLTLLQRCTIAINQGGINSINETIHMEKPMVVLNGGKFDQAGCAARIHYHKLGIAIMDKFASGRLQEAIYEVNSNPIYLNKIKKLKNAAENYRSEKVLEKSIIGIAENYA